MCTMQTPTSRLCETWETAIDAFARALRVTGSTSVIQMAFLTEAVQNEATFQVRRYLWGLERSLILGLTVKFLLMLEL